MEALVRLLNQSGYLLVRRKYEEISIFIVIGNIVTCKMRAKTSGFLRSDLKYTHKLKEFEYDINGVRTKNIGKTFNN
ncbi:Uncharacterised protein [Streptobacillus moniliformis]|nr:Uncharacterised protein [Streptobacillus moniliformis]